MLIDLIGTGIGLPPDPHHEDHLPGHWTVTSVAGAEEALTALRSAGASPLVMTLAIGGKTRRTVVESQDTAEGALARLLPS